MFSWIPFYEELANEILNYRDRQKELIEILNEIRGMKLPVNKMRDKDSQGEIPLDEIDPFTFYSTFNRGITDSNRIEILRNIKKKLKLKTNVPSDFEGIPVVDMRQSWFFPYKFERKPNDIEALWDLARAAVTEEIKNLKTNLFERCLKIKTVGLPKLTVGLFWLCPRKFMPFDKRSRAFFQKKEIAIDVSNFDSYKNFLQKVRAKFEDDFPELSLKAYEDFDKEPIKNKDVTCWQIAPGEQARLWDDLRANSIVAVGWDPLNLDLTGRSKEELLDLYQQYHPEETPTQTKFGVGMLWNFLNLKPGDRFVTNKGRSLLLGLGIIKGTYKFKPKRAEYKHTIEVDYYKVSEAGVPVPAKYRGKLGKTITPLTKAEFEDMEKLFDPEIIKFDKLQKVIESYARPKWEAVESEEWPWRNGGGEVYLQEDILKKASPHLTEEALREEAKESLFIALKADVNLLSQYEWMYAKTFIQEVPEEELRDHILALLYGPEELGTRLRRFLDWGKVVPIPEKNMKKGINATVASFLLAMSNPRRYPFCKPAAYNSAVSELIGKSAVREDPVERVIHCQEFYSKVLQFLEDEYGLEDGNLLDVSSMFFCFQEKDKDGLTAWDRMKEPGEIESIEEQTSDNPIFELLMEKHNVVLYGPPGTGKTREALLLGNWWKTTYGVDTVRQITFHPSYCYEDFIEGYRPTLDGSGFQLKPGIFKNICQTAGSDSSKRYLLIIDEINRGDVARILGELITLLEGDKRGPSYSATLQQSGDVFYVPENLYVLGTMNTADKSISLMDLAIRRRFLFQYFPPNPDVLDEAKGFLSEVAGIRLSSLLIGLNQKLMNIGVDRDRVLGHSFLLISKEALNPLATLKKRFQYEIIPLVEEYCYADRASMSRVLGDLVEANGLINVDVLEDEERFLSALEDLSYIE